MKDLGTLGTGTDSLGQEINEAGEVAGISATDQTAHTETGGLPTIHPFFCGDAERWLIWEIWEARSEFLTP